MYSSILEYIILSEKKYTEFNKDLFPTKSCSKNYIEGPDSDSI